MIRIICMNMLFAVRVTSHPYCRCVFVLVSCQLTGTDFAYEAAMIQAKAIAMTGVDILCDSSYRKSIQDQFQVDLVADKST